MTDKPQKLVMQLVAERDTKNTRLFAEYVPLGANARVGRLYVRLTTVAQLDNAERMRVTIHAGIVETANGITVHFAADKPTKNTVLYQEQPDGDIRIGPLYVQKTALKELDYPEELSLTLEVDDYEPMPRGGPQ